MLDNLAIFEGYEHLDGVWPNVCQIFEGPMSETSDGFDQN